MRKLMIAAVSLLFLVTACDAILGTSDGQPELSAEPSASFEELIDTAPEDFTWEFANDEVVVTAGGDPSLDGIELCAALVQAGDIADQVCTLPISVDFDRLVDGVKTGELHPDTTGWIPGTDWFPTRTWAPGGVPLYVPDTTGWRPASETFLQDVLSEMTAATASDVNGVIVFVQPSDAFQTPDTLEAATVTKPFGLVMEDTTSS